MYQWNTNSKIIGQVLDTYIYLHIYIYIIYHIQLKSENQNSKVKTQESKPTLNLKTKSLYQQ